MPRVFPFFEISFHLFNSWLSSIRLRLADVHGVVPYTNHPNPSLFWPCTRPHPFLPFFHACVCLQVPSLSMACLPVRAPPAPATTVRRFFLSFLQVCQGTVLPTCPSLCLNTTRTHHRGVSLIFFPFFFFSHRTCPFTAQRWVARKTGNTPDRCSGDTCVRRATHH